MSISESTHTLDPSTRWRFLRDVGVFQLKLVLNNLQTLILVPISLGAAVIDLIFNGERAGSLFYKVLEWGRVTDEAIDIYSAIGGYRATAPGSGDGNRGDFTVDAVLAHVEAVIAREYERGGTAASLKGAVDRTIDEIQARGVKGKDRLSDAFERAKRNLGSKLP